MADAINGMAELRLKLGKLAPAMLILAGKALYEAAREDVEAVAMDRVPILHDTLRGTIETLPPAIEDDKMTVRVVCGGPAAPYAIAVHEHLSEYSPPSWKKAEENGTPVHFNVGGPKFLESALNEAVPDLVTNIATRMEIKDAWEDA